ncbi:ester cyclase [Haloarchaeobius sp. HME9146]|uniref:ester cyclase n=1 Tax=Haloarchaeobius sp. HME9146 TaxID=2978732 RepID=UPI0021BE745B|nr:ester cyclase [Haloarchaeobius sp. HME9146]MCT9096684.1 ester cyclase [Haloarchaeobius sp. HME9146]
MPGGQEHLTSTEYERITRCLVEDGHDRGDPTVFYEHFSKNCVLMSDPTRSFGPSELADRILRFHDAVPDVSETVDSIHVDGDVVVVRTTRTGTFENEWRLSIDGEELVFEPTGEQFSCELLYTARFEDDQIVEIDGYGHNDLWFAMGIIPDPFSFAR